MNSNPIAEPKPGLEVRTDRGICTLLYTERPGHPEGSWVAVLMDGSAIVLTQEEIAQCLSKNY